MVHPPSKEQVGRKSKQSEQQQLEIIRGLAKQLLQEIALLGHLRKGVNLPQPLSQGIEFFDVMHRFKKDLLERGLILTGGRQSRAAQLLGIKPTTLNEMLKRYEIEPTNYQEGLRSAVGLDETNDSQQQPCTN